MYNTIGNRRIALKWRSFNVIFMCSNIVKYSSKLHLILLFIHVAFNCRFNSTLVLFLEYIVRFVKQRPVVFNVSRYWWFLVNGNIWQLVLLSKHFQWRKKGLILYDVSAILIHLDPGRREAIVIIPRVNTGTFACSVKLDLYHGCCSLHPLVIMIHDIDSLLRRYSVLPFK